MSVCNSEREKTAFKAFSKILIEHIIQEKIARYWNQIKQIHKAQNSSGERRLTYCQFINDAFFSQINYDVIN